MTTSRTGTAQWKRVREQAINRAKRDGVTHCVVCGVELDYVNGRTPSSAEVDHIIPASQGGKDHLSNVRVICRFDNQSLGGKQNQPPKPPRAPLKTSRKW